MVTPRGGGLAVALVVLAGFGLLVLRGTLPLGFFVGAFGAGMLVAFVGWIDDRGHVAARWRLLIHFLAAGWGLYWLGGAPELAFAASSVDLGLLGQVIAVFYIVWLLNLYNFMDGIDGIAGVQAVTVCIGAALLYLLVPGGAREIPSLLLLAAATLGFLYWNFPRAQIFMGDVGSGFIGLMLGLLSLRAGWVSAELIWSWLILLGVFIVDASMTLLRRLLRGEALHEPHRLHAYQYASRKVNSHVAVTVAVGLINVFWLLPLAALVVVGVIGGAVGVAVAFSPLIAVGFFFKAGASELQES